MRRECTGICVAAAVLAAARSAPAAVTRLDFEAPALGAAARAIHHPFVGPGVTFRADTDHAADAVVGLVRNGATSACVDPASTDQKLGTGRTAFGPDGDIGHSGYSIHATFSPPLAAPAGSRVFVEADFQVRQGTRLRIQLLGAQGEAIGETIRTAEDAHGTCGNPGMDRSRTRVRAESPSLVHGAVFEINPTNLVFVLDDVAFGTSPVAVEIATWTAIKAIYRD